MSLIIQFLYKESHILRVNGPIIFEIWKNITINMHYT